jgi:hypothetical protein
VLQVYFLAHEALILCAGARTSYSINYGL